MAESKTVPLLAVGCAAGRRFAAGDEVGDLRQRQASRSAVTDPAGSLAGAWVVVHAHAAAVAGLRDRGAHECRVGPVERWLRDPEDLSQFVRGDVVRRHGGRILPPWA